MAIQKFTGELDEVVSEPKVVKFTGELDEVFSEPKIIKFDGKLDGETPTTQAAPQLKPITAPVAEQVPPTQVAPQAQPTTPQAQPTTPQAQPTTPQGQPELTAYTPSFIDRVGRFLGLGPNRDRASVELAARQIAKDQGISVSEVYKQAGGSRAMFNPEGRATLPAIGEATVVAGQSAQDIPSAFANTALRAIRGGDISGGEPSFLDYAIKQTETPDRKVDKNYEDLGGLGKSLGYSFATMGASILAGAATGLATANPLVGGATMLGVSGTVSYRASKDEFLDRVKTQLNDKTKQLYGRELTKDEWQSVRGDFESAAIKYGSWEAATEAVGNLLMIKAFSVPARGMSKSALNKLVERAASIGVENIGETATGVGQRQAEIEAGLSKEELSVKDAFKQQFLSTMLLGGTMAAGAKGSQMATDFYQKYVEPKVNPQSALGRAIMMDLEDAVVNPQQIDAQAISALQGVKPPTLDELAGQKNSLEQKKIEPKLFSNNEPPEEELITDTAPGIAVSYPKIEPATTIDPETGEVLPISTADTTSEEQLIATEADRFAKAYNLPLDLATEIARREYREGNLNADTANIGADTGRIEPSLPMSSEGTLPPEGATAPNISGLGTPLGNTEQAIVGETTERPPLAEETGLPEITPTNTYAELPPEYKEEVLQGARQMWEAGEANLPTAKAWNSLPSWKRDMFAEEVYANYEEMASNGEVFRAAVDKVVEAKKPEPITPAPTSATLTPDSATLTPDSATQLQQQAVPAPVAQAQLNFNAAETAVAEATTPEAKKEATKQRNVARQELKKVETTAPIETTAPKTAEVKETIPTMQEMQDAGFLPHEIENLKKDYWPKRYRQIKEGYKYIGGEFRQVTQADVDTVKKGNKQRQVLKAEAKEKMDKAFAEDPRAGVSNIVGSDWGMGAGANQTTEQYQKAAYAALDRKYGFADSGVDILESRLAAAKKATTAPTTPKTETRGRRKNPTLPTEDQIVKDVNRRAAQANAIKGSREVDRIIKFLSSEFDPAKYKSDYYTEVAEQGLVNVRRGLMYELNKYATSPEYRTKPTSGVKAKDFLAKSDKLSLKERAELKARLEFEKNNTSKPLRAEGKTTDKPVKAFYKFTNAEQALNHIIRNGTPFEKALARRLKPFVTDVKLVVADTQENTTDDAKKLLGTASGVYSSRRFGDKNYRMIVLRGENFDDASLQGVNNTVFLHEGVHAGTEAKIDQYLQLTRMGKPIPAELQKVINELYATMAATQEAYENLKASGQPISVNLRHKFEPAETKIGPDKVSGLDILNNLKEFVAYGMTDPEVQQFLLTTPGGARKDLTGGFWGNLFNRFVDTLRKAFKMSNTDQSALQDLMLITEGLLQEQQYDPVRSVNTVLNAKIVKADEAVAKAILSVESSESPDLLQEAAQGRSFKPYRDALDSRWGSMSNEAKARILFVVPTGELVAWKGDQIPAFKDIDENIQRMAGMRQMMLKSFSKPADALGKFARIQGEKGMNAMATAMHTARLVSVSPSLFIDRADALKNDPRIVSLTNEKAGIGLSQNQILEIDKLIQERRESIGVTFDAWENLGRFSDGQKNYKMVRQFYKDSAALTRALLDKNIDRLQITGDSNDPATPKGRLMLSVRRMYENSDFKGIDEYFPFMRHGLHVLEVKGPNGRETYHFDTAKKRTDYINKRAKQLNVDPKAEVGNIFKVRTETGNEMRDQYAAESVMLTDMFNAIETATSASTLNKEELKNQLYQVYLTSLPEQSFRKHFIQSDNVTGFSNDIFRNFRISATRIASQAANLRYSPEVIADIQRAKDTLEGMPPAKQAELQVFTNEMERRALTELASPKENVWANRAAQFSFYMLLSGVGSAAIQMTATPLYILPPLRTDYGSVKVTKAFAKWATLFKSLGFKSEDVDGVRTMTAPTVGESSLVRNNPIYQRAFNEALARDILGQSLSSTVIDLRRTPANATDALYKNVGNSLLNITAGLFSGSERLTREISYMMAFDLAYKESGDFDKSVKKAIDIVQMYIGRFDRFNRSPAQQGWGKVILQYKPYPLLVTVFLVKNLIKVAGVYGKKEAWRAANTLSGILLMGTMFYGVTGLPLYDVLCATIDALLDDLEEEEGYLNKAVKNLLGEEAAQEQSRDKLARIRKNVLTATNSDMRFRYEFLPKWFGGIKFGGEDGNEFSLATNIERGPVSVMSDVNVGPRMALNGMWYKTVKESEELKETLSNYAEALLTPPVSGAGERIIDGANDIVEDKKLRGAGQLLPAALANPVKAVLVQQEGIKTRKGDVVLSKDELTTVNIIAQATGIGSTRAAAIQERNYKYYAEEIKARNKKTKLLKDYAELVTSTDKTAEEKTKGFTSWWNRFTQYNKRYPLPGLELTVDSVEEVGKNALEKASMAVRGYRLKDTLAPYILPQMGKYTNQIMGKE